MYKHFLLAGLVGVMVMPALADLPTFTFVRSIEIGSATTFYPRMTSAIADASGGVYFTENASKDDIFYMANPLTAAAATDSQLAFGGALLSPGFSSGSWMGLTVDSNGTVFGSGSGTNRSALARIVNVGGTITPTEITLPAAFASGTGFTRLGGCTAVGPNKLVIPGYSDGKLYFFTVSGSAATLDGSINAPAGFAGVAPHALYADGKIFMTNAVVGGTATTGQNGGFWVRPSDGTIAGTGAATKLADPKAGSSSSNSLYQTLSYNAAYNVYATNEGHNVADQQGWAIYNGLQSTASAWTSYKFLNGSETGAPGALLAGDAALGHTFFTKAGEHYFIGSNEDVTRKFLVYQLSPGSSVSDWSVY